MKQKMVITDENITLPISSNLLKQANRVYGSTVQLFVAVEECAEFIKAAMKYENRKGSIDDLIDEAADALFLLAQVRSIVGEERFDCSLLKAQEKLREKKSMQDNRETKE